MILGIIPARGGSKRIPRKNVKTLYGKPLLMWTIEAAQQSRLLNHFIVSTEDIDIANLAIWGGADVMIRPDELATDDATTMVVMQHVLKSWEARSPSLDVDMVVLLQPTSPIRFDEIIDRAILAYLHNDLVCDCLATGYWTTHCAWTSRHGPRQKQEAYFHDDGCVYVWDAELIRKGRWQGDFPKFMAVDSIYNTEIDELADFWRIEGIMAHYDDE